MCGCQGWPASQSDSDPGSGTTQHKRTADDDAHAGPDFTQALGQLGARVLDLLVGGVRRGWVSGTRQAAQRKT